MYLIKEGLGTKLFCIAHNALISQFSRPHEGVFRREAEPTVAARNGQEAIEPLCGWPKAQELSIASKSGSRLGFRDG